MIVFQNKGHSHRLSRLKGKEKDVIKKNFYIQHQVQRRHIGARKTAKPSKIKARSSQPCTNCSLYRCAYDAHNYDAQQHRAGQIISPLTLQTITIARMLSVGGEGWAIGRPNGINIHLVVLLKNSLKTKTGLLRRNGQDDTSLSGFIVCLFCFVIMVNKVEYYNSP